MSDLKSSILVAGATGLVGQEVCRKLTSRGSRVRALVRSSSSQDKTDGLRKSGAELFVGDLKDDASLREACRGASSIISTASSTLSRQSGDSIESVDRDGQIKLIEAAKRENISRFIFVSFRRQMGPPSPLSEAKGAVEKALAPLNFTIIQASCFMEVWLSPALGFDYANAKARIYGAGTGRISWVSFHDVVEMCVMAQQNAATSRRTIAFGGPEAITPLDVVARFERLSGTKFQLEHVPESALRAQYESATDSMQKSFAALMLGAANGDAIDMNSTIEEFGLSLTSVDDYARGVLGQG